MRYPFRVPVLKYTRKRGKGEVCIFIKRRGLPAFRVLWEQSLPGAASQNAVNYRKIK